MVGWLIAKISSFASRWAALYALPPSKDFAANPRFFAEATMDVLSEALHTVRMTGAIFYYAECTSPWGFAVPPLQQVAHVLAPGTERLVPYHLVAEGEAVVRFEGATVDIPLQAGDVVIIPHGDAHTVSNGSPSKLIDSAAELGKFLGGDLRTMRLGGGGAATTFVCGYFGCERHADALFLAGLPQMIKINMRGDATGQWLESSIRYLVAEADRGRAGQNVLLSKMAEALFIQTLRIYMERLPPEQTGWLAGARDPIVGGCLALMHQQPFRRWSLTDLAKEVAASKSVVADRFAQLLGEGPLTYLARWRLQLAARLLQTTRKTIVQVASEVGYESEAAFNRAFKREFTLPPAKYRKSVRQNAR
jgi:AraC-like DNA-binding protein